MLVCVLMYKFGKANSMWVEMRLLDLVCNLYLVFVVLIVVGMKGIEENYELPPGAEDDVWVLLDIECMVFGYVELLYNLFDVLCVMEWLELVVEMLGEYVFDFFLCNKCDEWIEYCVEVSLFELRCYLFVL